MSRKKKYNGDGDMSNDNQNNEDVLEETPVIREPVEDALSDDSSMEDEVEEVAEEVPETEEAVIPKPTVIRKREETVYSTVVCAKSVLISVPLDVDDKPEWQDLRYKVAAADALMIGISRKVVKAASGVVNSGRSRLDLAGKQLTKVIEFADEQGADVVDGLKSSI